MEMSKVTLVYANGEVIQLKMGTDKVKEFIFHFVNDQFYYNSETGFGYWTQKAQIQHVEIEKETKNSVRTYSEK